MITKDSRMQSTESQILFRSCGRGTPFSDQKRGIKIGDPRLWRTHRAAAAGRVSRARRLLVARRAVLRTRDPVGRLIADESPRAHPRKPTHRIACYYLL
jgi:hypothetical protein